MNQLFKSIPILYLITLVSAQYGNPGNSGSSTVTSSSLLPSSTTTSATAVQTVTVGASGLTFSPDTLTVSAGSKVEFHFQSGNHSVAQASFEDPCHPMSETSISSGFVTGGSSSIFTLTVNDTTPIWYYCGQPGHCQAGMVGVINPPASGSNTLAAFKASAAKADDTTVPASVNGGVFGAATSSSPTISGTSAASSPSHTGDARILHTWTNMTILLVLSVLVALCLV